MGRVDPVLILLGLAAIVFGVWLLVEAVAFWHKRRMTARLGAAADMFRQAATGLLDGTPDLLLEPYTLDFAILARKIYIEIADDPPDAARERWLLQRGWVVIRFTPGEVRADPQACVREARAVVAAHEDAHYQTDGLSHTVHVEGEDTQS